MNSYGGLGSNRRVPDPYAALQIVITSHAPVACMHTLQSHLLLGAAIHFQTGGYGALRITGEAGQGNCIWHM